MTDAQIATSGAPAWEKTIMTAMAHYGMYVNDTDGIGNIELEAESDISYTSLGGQPLMSNFISQQGGWYYSPLNRWIMGGPGIPVSKLRVVDPCWAQSLCSGAGTTTSDPTPPTTAPPSSTPPTPTPPTTTLVSPDAAGHPRPGDPRAGANAAPSAPVTPRPAPVTSTPAKPAPKKKQSKPKRRSNIAHTASASTRSCKTSRSPHRQEGRHARHLRRPPSRRLSATPPADTDRPRPTTSDLVDDPQIAERIGDLGGRLLIPGPGEPGALANGAQGVASPPRQRRSARLARDDRHLAIRPRAPVAQRPAGVLGRHVLLAEPVIDAPRGPLHGQDLMRGLARVHAVNGQRAAHPHGVEPGDEDPQPQVVLLGQRAVTRRNRRPPRGPPRAPSRT